MIFTTVFKKIKNNNLLKYLKTAVKKIKNDLQNSNQENVNESRLAKDLNVSKTTLNTLCKDEKIIFKFKEEHNANRKSRNLNLMM